MGIMYKNGIEDKVCVHLWVFIYPVSIDRKNIVLINFQSWGHMYPYHTETTTIIGIKPIAIHTN